MTLKTKIAIGFTLIGVIAIYVGGFIMSSVYSKNNPGTDNNYILYSQYIAIAFLAVMAVILTIFIHNDVSHMKRRR